MQCTVHFELIEKASLLLPPMIVRKSCITIFFTVLGKVVIKFKLSSLSDNKKLYKIFKFLHYLTEKFRDIIFQNGPWCAQRSFDTQRTSSECRRRIFKEKLNRIYVKFAVSLPTLRIGSKFKSLVPMTQLVQIF